MDLLEICFVVKTMLDDSEHDDDDDHENSETNLMFSYKSASIDATSQMVIDAKNALIGKIQLLTIDSWMDLSEKSTINLDFSSINWWPYVEMPPSNYQLLIAHYCHQLVSISPDMIPVLSNFAMEYRKEYGKSI